MKRKRIVTGLLTISMESFAKRMGWRPHIVTKDKCGTVGCGRNSIEREKRRKPLKCNGFRRFCNTEDYGDTLLAPSSAQSAFAAFVSTANAARRPFCRVSENSFSSPSSCISSRFAFATSCAGRSESKSCKSKSTPLMIYVSLSASKKKRPSLG